MWETIDWQYMTEESDAEDNSIIVHALLWRSEGFQSFLSFFLVIKSGVYLALNWLIKALDDRYNQKIHKEGGLFIKKDRSTGPPSKSYPPFNAPEWSINPSYLPV